MEKQNKKIASKVINIFVWIVVGLILLVTISTITSKAQGYSNLLGYTAYAVKSESMVGSNADSFNKGDLIFVKLLSDEEKANLEVGQVITFWDWIDTNGDGIKEHELNTHRIVSINEATGQITTKGDNNSDNDSTIRDIAEDVIGVYSSKIGYVGSFVLFIQSATGFLVFIVVPSLLIVLYCVYLLIKNFKVYNKEKKTDELVKLRQDVMKELEAQKEKEKAESDKQG